MLLIVKYKGGKTSGEMPEDIEPVAVMESYVAMEGSVLNLIDALELDTEDRYGLVQVDRVESFAELRTKLTGR